MFRCEKLKECREKNSQSQEDIICGLAGLGLRISRQTIGNWETGVSAPDANEIAVIARLFKKPVQYFFAS